MGAIYNSIPTWLAEALRRELRLTTFVESGLGQGTSALWAESHFINGASERIITVTACVSIEIDQTLVEQFRERYPHSRIHLFCGDSGVELAGIVPLVLLPALFWLDGHADDYTPVLTEIAAINASRLDHVILVDDLRLFGQLPAWPTRTQLIEAAQDSGRRATFEIDDVLIAAPVAQADKVRRIIEDR